MNRFNLPVEIIDLISTLEPENQGIIYSHLFAYIYHETPIADDIDPRCRLILTMILDRLDARIRRARATAERARERAAAKAAATDTPDDNTGRPDDAAAAAPAMSEVAAHIIQNGNAAHDRISPLGEALFAAQMQKHNETGATRQSARRHRSRRR
ncbi:MAG: hypothetical protein Q4C34_02310 [Bacteroidales bacterium]|nr:hypothetical protein [Bacteroidales bacterium]